MFSYSSLYFTSPRRRWNAASVWISAHQVWQVIPCKAFLCCCDELICCLLFQTLFHTDLLWHFWDWFIITSVVFFLPTPWKSKSFPLFIQWLRSVHFLICWSEKLILFFPDSIKKYVSPPVQLIRLILNCLHCGSSRQAELLISALSQTLWAL